MRPSFSSLVVTLSVGAQHLLGYTSTNLTQPSIKLAKHTAWYAAAVECPQPELESWACRSCKKASEARPDVIRFFESKKTDASGYVAINHRTKHVVLAFRRTTSLSLVGLDVNLVQTEFNELGPSLITFHRGFLDAINSVTPLFMPHLGILKNKSYRLTITGVSIGGAMASLAAVRVHNRLGVKYSRMTVVTFGQPRTGNERYARAYNQLPIRYARVINYNDPVPHLPPSNIDHNAHHHNELFIDGSSEARYCRTDVLEDPGCANSVPVYRYNPISHFSAFGIRFRGQEN